MRQRKLPAVFAFIFLFGFGLPKAQAQCALPYVLTNGQPADATQVMANYNALLSCVNTAAPAGSNNAVQYNAGSGAFGAVGPLTNGQLIIGSTGAAPQVQTLTAGTGIVIANAPGSITVSTAPGTGAGLYSAVLSSVPTGTSTGLINWLNQRGSISSNSPVGLSMNVPTSSTGNLTGLYRSAVTAPYTITALIAATRNSASYNGVSIGWYDGTNKLHLLSYLTQNGGVPLLSVDKWDSYSSFNSSDFTSSPNAFSQPIWLRMADDGTNVSFGFSQDGANFLTLFSTPKSSGFLGATGYSNVIFASNPLASQTIATLMSWTQN